MPTVAENLKCWDEKYNWPGRGDEWSTEFGGTEALWWFIVYPRVHRFLPAQTILEIGPGFGRWTQFLKDQCKSIIAVDLSERCVDQCRMRFAADNHMQFHVNDGSSLDAVPDNSVDFVFSFDSLVHAEKEIIEAYIVQLGRKLKPSGVGFIHHSNLGAYVGRLRVLKYYSLLPDAFRRHVLKQANIAALLSINFDAWRATSMNSDLFRQYCKQAGLKCISQELINWGKGKCQIDCFSVFAKPQSSWDRENAFLKNGEFLKNANLTSRLARLYCL